MTELVWRRFIVGELCADATSQYVHPGFVEARRILGDVVLSEVEVLEVQGPRQQFKPARGRRRACPLGRLCGAERGATGAR